MQIQKLIFIGLACFLFTPKCIFAAGQPANNQPKPFPAELIYKEQPIDPLCLEEPEKSDSIISLKSCGLANQREITKLGYDKKRIKRDFIGYDYAWDGGVKNSEPLQGYSYYKILGNINNSYLIYSVHSGGGSGAFSALLLVTRKNFYNIQIKILNSGDRCNNGIDNVKLTPKDLTYNVYITPFDFLVLTQQNPYHLKAYKDLDACAACCAGIAHFKRNLDNINNEVLVNVELTGHTNAMGPPYQICFDTLAEKYLDRGKRVLKPEFLNQFMQTFNAKCINNSQSDRRSALQNPTQP